MKSGRKNREESTWSTLEVNGQRSKVNGQLLQWWHTDVAANKADVALLQLGLTWLLADCARVVHAQMVVAAKRMRFTRRTPGGA
jgi:hypothetical protein